MNPCNLVNGPLIVGAGPSGLAVAACLRLQGVPFIIVERATCIASLWQNRTYDRLKLHLPKQFCHLPHAPFPATFPEYPSRTQFVSYLESYADRFQIHPKFGETVLHATHDSSSGLWRVATSTSTNESSTEYICRWLVVATGENAEKITPEFDGFRSFLGSSIHACDYKSGEDFAGKQVLVVGCGNSGMEVSLDLSNHAAFPSMVVRSSVHVLPREILGKSTYEVAATMMKWLPVKAVDWLMLTAARLILGDTEKFRLKRPSTGPMELKQTQGKTPVLDIGAVSKIQSGLIKVVPGINNFSKGGVELVNGDFHKVDSVIFATGYSSNVPSWLKETKFFSKEGFPNGWKGENGLYAVGFARRGLAGVSLDAAKVAGDIGEIWNRETALNNHCIRVGISQRLSICL